MLHGVGQLSDLDFSPVLGAAEAKGCRILMVEDVWTTGATLLRCAQALRRAGAQEIQVLALFRAL